MWLGKEMKSVVAALVFCAIEKDKHLHFILAGTFLGRRVAERNCEKSMKNTNKNILTGHSYFLLFEIFDLYFFIHFKRRQLNNRKEVFINLSKTNLMENKPVSCWDGG